MGARRGGGFIQFKVVEPQEVEFNERILKSDEPVFGHPFGNYFFCDEHTGLGLKYEHLIWSEAEPLIREAFENNDIPEPPVKSGRFGGLFKIIDRFFSKS
jgi:hypothetical protein